MHADWLIAQWPAPSRVRAVCSTRAGGHSSGPYASLNLGAHVGDDPGKVAANRAEFTRCLGARALFLDQVHGLEVANLDAGNTDALQADAARTTTLGLACTIMVADCLPVLFCDTQGRQVAAAHAGWRGMAGANGSGILERTCLSMSTCTQAPVAPADVMVWLGPCIGPKVFEVGAEVLDQFVANDPQAAQHFKPHGSGKWLADLAGLARLRLQAIGVQQIFGNDSSDAWCTVSNPQRYFSYRRDRVCGRFAASIWLDA